MESIFNILAGFTSVSAGQPFSEGTGGQVFLHTKSAVTSSEDFAGCMSMKFLERYMDGKHF